VRAVVRLPWVSFCFDAGSLAPESVFLKCGTRPRAYGSFARLFAQPEAVDSQCASTRAVAPPSVVLTVSKITVGLDGPARSASTAVVAAPNKRSCWSSACQVTALGDGI